MKILTHFITLIFVFFLLTSSSCKKDDELTKPTQEGKNTFSCKLNGGVYLPNDGGLLSPVKAITSSVTIIDSKNNQLRVFANRSNSPKVEKIRLFINSITGTGTYSLKGENGQYCEYSILDPSPSSPLDKTYTTRIYNEGVVTITRYDLINGIVSGTFSFKAVNDKDANDVVTVSDGRFDVTLN